MTARYDRYLPGVLRRDPVVGTLLRIVGDVFADLDAGIDALPGHLLPLTADPEFLPWLADWLAVPVTPGHDERALRTLLSRIVPLYRRRGTASGLHEMLLVALDGVVEVPFTVAVRDDLEPAHFFAVQVTLPAPDPDAMARVADVARAVIEREKPAHTWYALRVAVPTMRLVSPDLHDSEEPPPDFLVLGENTVLGTETR